jgi:hypothetical protein
MARTERDGEAARLVDGEALGEDLAQLVRVARPRGAVDAWATVELDRAEVELAPLAAGQAGTAHGQGPAYAAAEDVPAEQILGAACRLVRGPDGAAVVLLEPSTEGRLAAALARHGEGFVARYFLVDADGVERVRRAGFRLTAVAPGPFGPERLVLTGPRDGPFVILAASD